MIHRKKLVRYLVPHIHADGSHHRAHAISPRALLGWLQVLIFLTVGLYLLRANGAQILGVAQFSATEIIEATNNRRIEDGLPPLVVNEKLSEAAAQKASDIYTNNYWAHNSPAGRTPWDFINATGYSYVFAGENLARDFTSAQEVVKAWMRSPTHRANLLDGNFREIGVAVAGGNLQGKEGTLVVQMFGTSRESPSFAKATEGKPSSESKVEGSQTLTENQQVTVLASRRMIIARTVSLGLTGLIFGLFLTEIWVSARRADMPKKAGVFAHLAILGLVLLAVWYAAQGAIL